MSTTEPMMIAGSMVAGHQKVAVDPIDHSGVIEDTVRKDHHRHRAVTQIITQGIMQGTVTISDPQARSTLKASCNKCSVSVWTP